MKHLSTKSLLTSALMLSAVTLSSFASKPNVQAFDLSKFRYRIDTPSVFNNRDAKTIEKLNALITPDNSVRRAPAVETPVPITLPPADLIGSIDAPNGELWYYTGQFEYLEIPPDHEAGIWYTDHILQEYTFTIYDADLKVVGTIKDKMDYAENEVRTVLCEITPVITRNFFNTDDSYEVMVALGINTEQFVNNYRTLVYALNGEKDADGFDKVTMVIDDIVGDVIEGPATDGSDNFYITFMRDVFEYEPGSEDDDSFWPLLLAQKASIDVYGKANDDINGPRLIYSRTIPLIQFPGDQQDVPVLMSMRQGNDVVFCIQEYAEPFYNRYDDPMSEEMTQREGNRLIINLYKATEEGLTLFSTTNIPVVLDPMKDSAGNPTCLFSYFSVGNLDYRDDILFNAPGTDPEKPDFIVTRGNYQTTTDGIIDSYFTYKNDGSLKNTIFLYADGTRAMGDLEGFEPQQMFVSKDAYGYIYNFVDLYSATNVAQIDADYYYDDDSDSELLTTNVARTPEGDSYKYVFELRYPLVDDNENDILRFMYINRDATYDHTENVNLGKNVIYAQSYLSTEALAPHAYSVSDTPAFMMLVKRGIEGQALVEELTVAEAVTDENPEGVTLLQVGPNESGNLATIVPEFAQGDRASGLFVYYYDNETSKYTLDIYQLPLNDPSGVESVGEETPEISIEGSALVANGEIKVYTLDGKLVASGTDSVEFASLESGIYVINAGGKTYKIMK